MFWWRFNHVFALNLWLTGEQSMIYSRVIDNLFVRGRGYSDQNRTWRRLWNRAFIRKQLCANMLKEIWRREGHFRSFALRGGGKSELKTVSSGYGQKKAARWQPVYITTYLQLIINLKNITVMLDYTPEWLSGFVSSTHPSLPSRVAVPCTHSALQPFLPFWW